MSFFTVVYLLIYFYEASTRTAEYYGDVHYVAAIVLKQRLPVSTVASGVLLTDRVIVAMFYPMKTYASSDVCVLVGFTENLDTYAWSQFESECKDVRELYTDVNMSPEARDGGLIILRIDPLSFRWSLNMPVFLSYKGNVPHITSFTNCFAGYWKLGECKAPPGYICNSGPANLTMVEVEISADGCVKKGPNNRWERCAKLKSNAKLCRTVVGMPIVCNCALLGIISMVTPELDGPYDCMDTDVISYISFFSKNIEDFIVDTINQVAKL